MRKELNFLPSPSFGDYQYLRHKAFELVFTGDPVSATEGAQMGPIN